MNVTSVALKTRYMVEMEWASIFWRATINEKRVVGLRDQFETTIMIRHIIDSH